LFFSWVNHDFKVFLIKSNRYAEDLKITFTILIWTLISKKRKRERDIQLFFSLVFPIVLVDSFLHFDRRGRALDVHSGENDN